MPEPIETTGPDIESAIQQALSQLGVSRDNVTIEVLEEPQRRLLGLGTKLARVRVTPIERPLAVNPAPAPRPPATPAAPSPALDPEPFQLSEQSRAALRQSEGTKFTLRDEAPAQKPRVEPRHIPDEDAPEATESGPVDREAEVGVEILQTLLDHMGVAAKVRPRHAETDGHEVQHWLLEVRGESLGDLIGTKGETLAALQYLTRLMASNQLNKRANLVIDIEGYKSRREEMLKRLARKMAAQAVERGRMVSMEPMTPAERRIIHLTLRDNQDVTTESVGEGERRKVTIIPKRQGGR